MGNLAEDLVRLVLLVPVFIPAIVLHEFAHAWAAHRLGDMTAKMLGRLTLDPKVHFDPLGALMFVVSSLSGVGFGWAKPVPVNFANLRNPIRDMVWVAAAGPASNLLQAVGWYAIFWLFCLVLPGPLLPADLPHGIRDSLLLTYVLDTPDSFARILLHLPALGLQLNLILMAFNLLPFPPLDGGRILVGILPHRQAAVVASLEPYGMLLLLAVLFLGVFQTLASPIMHLWLRLLTLGFVVL